MADLAYIYSPNYDACTSSALEREQASKQSGDNPLLISGRHISRLQLMEDSEISQHRVIIIDEAEVLKKNQVEFLLHIVNGLKIDVYAYGIRCDEKNIPYEGAMYCLAFATKIEELKIQETLIDTQDSQEEETELSPDMTEFLDARTYADRLEIFRRIRDNTDDDMINIMAVVLDITVPENDNIEVRREDVYNSLVTLVRFEVNR